jgi:hypothetical protein
MKLTRNLLENQRVSASITSFSRSTTGKFTGKLAQLTGKDSDFEPTLSNCRSDAEIAEEILNTELGQFG